MKYENVFFFKCPRPLEEYHDSVKSETLLYVELLVLNHFVHFVCGLCRSFYC